jgi:UDP-N-acetylglucosamine transferase subunit ALG13
LIFVTIGTALQGFDRLVNEVDRISASGNIPKEFFVQYGHSKPTISAKGASFLEREEVSRLICEAELVITHGGATLGVCMALGKKPIVVPRYARKGEAISDHQVALCRELEKTCRVNAVYNIAELEATIGRVISTKDWSTSSSQPQRIFQCVKEFLENIQ